MRRSIYSIRRHSRIHGHRPLQLPYGLGPETPLARALAYSPNLNRAALTGAAAVARMAEDLRERGGLATTTDDLELLGWQPDQIAAHGPAARQKALAQSARDISARRRGAKT